MNPKHLLLVACLGVLLLVACVALYEPRAAVGALGAALVFGAWKASES